MAKDPKIAYKTINARVETVDAAPSYRQAFKKRRCLIPVAFTNGRRCGEKNPYSIGMKDDASFVFAGLWEGWKDPATDEWLRTCTIIPGEPNELVAQIHTRMQVILPEDHMIILMITVFVIALKMIVFGTHDSMNEQRTGINERS